MTKPRKLLVIQTASIGDVILATSLIETLHQAYPEAQIDFLAKKGMEGLFISHPFLGRLHLWDKSDHKYLHLWRLLGRVRKEKYDIIINVQRFFSTGLITAFSGARYRIGFSKNPLSFLFTHTVEHEIRTGVHEIDRNHRLIAALGDYPLRNPRLYPPQEDLDAVKPYQDKPYITVAPASLWLTKQYPVDRWISMIQALPSHYRILLLGGRDDHALCETIVMALPERDVLNLSGTLTLLQSAALMKPARMNFVNDSSPMHLASAVNAPVSAVFCSTLPGFGFGPLSDEARVVQTRDELACRPCGLHGRKACPEGHFKCAYTIDNMELTRDL